MEFSTSNDLLWAWEWKKNLLLALFIVMIEKIGKERVNKREREGIENEKKEWLNKKNEWRERKNKRERKRERVRGWEREKGRERERERERCRKEREKEKKKEETKYWNPVLFAFSEKKIIILNYLLQWLGK